VAPPAQPPVQPPVAPPVQRQPNPRRGGPLTLDMAIEWLSGNQLQQLRSIGWLEKQKVDPARQADVAAALERCLNGNDRLVALSSLKALYVWATRAQVPSLLKALDDASPFVRQGAVVALGPLKDERAVVPVAKFLTDFGAREAAGRSLMAMGPMVETEVRKYLAHDDRGAREEAARVLRGIGKADAARDAFEMNLGGLKDRWNQTKSAEWFAKANPEHPRRAEVAAELAKLLKVGGFARAAAAKALVVWATKAQVPDLLAALDEEQRSLGGPAPHLLEALGKQKDKRAIVPVARFLSNHSHVRPAVKALVALGPETEETVLKYLNHKEFRTCVGACDVLRDVGTKKSLPALRATLANGRKDMWAGWRDVVQAAQAAIDAIEARSKE
jgi:HEAT repeat protein